MKFTTFLLMRVLHSGNHKGKITLKGMKMDKKEFSYFREKLKKTQKEIAHLLGKSIKAIHSYEQGWRVIPVDVERQIYFFGSTGIGKSGKTKTMLEDFKM